MRFSKMDSGKSGSAEVVSDRRNISFKSVTKQFPNEPKKRKNPLLRKTDSFRKRIGFVLNQFA
ncbi:hypothetical protein CH375_13090 [Leptospira ellisii]|nr:hypothetical protein CH375_13090 [Leptospira ellisii]